MIPANHHHLRVTLPGHASPTYHATGPTRHHAVVDLAADLHSDGHTTWSDKVVATLNERAKPTTALSQNVNLIHTYGSW